MKNNKVVMDRIRDAVQDAIKIKYDILSDDFLLNSIAQVSTLIVEALRRGNRIFFAGNGGSAADAQHLAAEFVSRFEFDRPGLPALSLSTDTSIITAIGNDYGYENLFLRQLQAQSKPGDIFVGITTSGKSSNVLRALEGCESLKIMSVVLCGEGGNLDEWVDYILRVNSPKTARIQESHILIGHIICAEVEQQIFKHLAPRKK